MAINLINELNKRFLEESKEIKKEGFELELLPIPLSEESETLLNTASDQNANEIQYTNRYETKAFSSTAINEADLPIPTIITRNEAENRISEVKDRVGIFIYNLFPYQTIDAVNAIRSASDDDKINKLLATSAMISLNGLTKLKYFTPAELALVLGHNFYTLQFFRGITIKKGKRGLIKGPANNNDIWTGEIDLFYGRGNDTTIGSTVREFFSGAQDIAESGNTKLAQEKMLTTPFYFDDLRVEKKSSFIDQLSNTNSLEITNRTELFKSILTSQISENGIAWSKTTGTEEYDKKDSEFRTNDTDSYKYLINESVLEINQRINEDENGSWLGQIDESKIYTKEFDFEQVKTRTNDTDSYKYLVNPDVNKINQRINKQNKGKWKPQTDKSQEEFTEYRLEDAEIRRGEIKKGKDVIKTNTINPDVINILLRKDPSDGKDSGEINGIKEDLLKEKGFTKLNGRWQIGAVYVIPIAAAQFRDSLPSFYIPFEFNPDIGENGIEAKYQQTEVLSRIGDMQSFIGTGSLSVSISTKYFAVSHDGSAGIEGLGQSWMADFTLEKLQAIEFAYRSLVLPHFPSEQSIDQGYKYVKPPLIKIVIGDSSNQSTPYANLLTYQSNKVIEGRLQTPFKEEKKLLRTFIATNVNIKKNLNETPIYLDENRTIRDTFGFEVSLNLMEVTPNYMDALPDFKNYFGQYDSIMEGQFVERTSDRTTNTELEL